MKRSTPSKSESKPKSKPVRKGGPAQKQPAVIEISEEQVRIRAYQLYEQRGRTDGSAMEDWLEAEREIAS